MYSVLSVRSQGLWKLPEGNQPVLPVSRQVTKIKIAPGAAVLPRFVAHRERELRRCRSEVLYQNA